MSKYLDLSGLTYFANKIKSAINAVSETASSALTAAGTAQRTADTASSKADAAQADATAALGRFVTLNIKGTTNMYGVIAMPNTSYYPIASLSRSYAICGNHNSIRVLNTETTNIVLAVNTSVDFNIIAMKRS